ncbi:MaoC family dehydratase N-terminal domain-containing protein [Rhodococcus erythropolis]|uniref:FAS1-like dehydratase domain-containing protein n=1 Tax=Rhodococcus erythropolis TaxID=1833 RepID=UPI0037AE6344
MIALIGTDLSDGSISWGADAVELGSIRRYLEPLELDSPIHYDTEAARAVGHADVVAPSTAILMYTMPPMWAPGDRTLFESPSRDAQPARSPINNQDQGPAPHTTGFFATDLEIDFVRPVIVGERLGRRGQRLLVCEPKETRVGRGAFCTHESEIVATSGEVVARLRASTYAYNPHSRSAQENQK